MTFEKAEIVCGGYTAGQLRHLFRATIRGHGVLDADSIRYDLHVSRLEAIQLVNTLLSEGYIEPYVPGRSGYVRDYQITKKAYDIAIMKFVPDITRKSADKIIKSLHEIILEVNNDSFELRHVGYAYLFGSYTSNSTNIDYIDVAVALARSPRLAPPIDDREYDRLHVEYANERNAQKSDTMSILSHPTEKVLSRIRNRRRSLRLHSILTHPFLHEHIIGKAQVVYQHPELGPLSNHIPKDPFILTEDWRRDFRNTLQVFKN